MRSPPHGRNTLYLSLVEAFWGVGLNVISVGTVLPVYLLGAGASNGTIALLPALGALGAGITQGFSGWLVRRSAHIKGWVLALHLLSPTPLALVGIWLLLGRGGGVAAVLLGWGAFYGFLGILFPLWLDYMARILDPARRGRAFGAIFFIQTTAGVGGAALASGVLERSTADGAYALLFLVAAAAMAGGSLLFVGTRGEILPPGPPPAPSSSGHFKEFFGLWREASWLRPYMVARWLTRGSYPLVAFFYAARAVAEWGATPSQAALLGAVALACQAVAGIAAGILGDHLGHRTAVVLGQAGLLVASVLVLFPIPLWGYFVVAALTGVYLATEYASQGNWIMELSGPSRRQGALALVGFLLTPTAVAVPLLGGWLMDGVGFRPVAAGVALVLLLAMVVELRLVPNPRPSQRPVG
jgi:MFS family permease